MTNADKKQDETLIERAARVYDFGAHLRRREEVAQPLVPDVAGETNAVTAPDVPLDVDVRADAAMPREHAEAPFDLIAAAPPAPEGAEVLSREAAATLMAIPPELRAGAEPDEEVEFHPAVALRGLIVRCWRKKACWCLVPRSGRWRKNSVW